MSQSTTKIRDLGLAAALVCIGVRISSTEKDDAGRTHFIFSYSEDNEVDMEVVTENYWLNYFQVDARQYFDAIKMLKSRIYAER